MKSAMRNTPTAMARLMASRPSSRKAGTGSTIIRTIEMIPIGNARPAKLPESFGLEAVAVVTTRQALRCVCQHEEVDRLDAKELTLGLRTKRGRGACRRRPEPRRRRRT